MIFILPSRYSSFTKFGLSLCLSTGYFGVSLASLTNKEDNVSSEVQSEDFTSSSNLDDTNRIVTLQSHSSSPDTPRPSSPNSKRKYSTSHIQRKVTPNSDPSSLETETTLLDMHTSTVPPNKAVFGSFTILDKPHFGDVFTSVATSKPPLENINEKIRITPSTNQPRKRTSPIANKHAGLIETANDEPVFRETDLDDKMLRHSPLESFAHNSLLDMYKPMMEEDEEIKTKSQPISKPEAAMPKEEISGVGEAQVIVLPAASSSHELLLSPHGTLHSKPTTFRPHTYTKSRQTTQHSVPPEIVVTTEARKATPSSVHRSSPKQKPNRNEVQKQILILKEKPAVMNQNLVPNRRKDEISTTNKNSQLIHGPSVSIQRHTDDYDSELKSISSFLKSEFPVLQKIGNLDEVLKAYKANRTMSSIQKKNDFVSSETAFNGDLAIMESSNEYQYAHTIRTPGNRHSPVVTLLPVRSNVGPGKPLRPRPYLGTRNNIGTTTITTIPTPTLEDDPHNIDSDYVDQHSSTHNTSSKTSPEKQIPHSNSEMYVHSKGLSSNSDSSKSPNLGFLEFANHFNHDSVKTKSSLDRGASMNIFKGHNLDYGALNTKDFYLPPPPNISDHIINDFSDSLLDKISVGDSPSLSEEAPPLDNGDDNFSTTEESRKVILNTEVVTSTSVKVSYGEGTASYTETTTKSSALRRPKRRENFRRPKISNFWQTNPPELDLSGSLNLNGTHELTVKNERTGKMAQDFLLHSNIHKMKFDRGKKDQAVNSGSSDRMDHGRAPFVVYATSLENNENLFSYGSEEHKDLLNKRDGDTKESGVKLENNTSEADSIEKKVILVMSSNSSNMLNFNENRTSDDNDNKNKAMAQNLLTQMLEKYNRVITNDSSVSSLKYLIDQISHQHLKHTHQHNPDTNISTKAIPSSFNFNQVNGIPILTKVYTKVSKTNSTSKERNQTEFHLSVNRSGMKDRY